MAGEVRRGREHALMKNPFADYDFGSWVYGLGAAFIGGGANAVCGGIAINMVDPAHFNARSKDFYIFVGALFLANGTMSFFLYLKQTPLPKVKTIITSVQEKTEFSPGSQTVSTLTVEKIVEKPADPPSAPAVTKKE